LALIYTHKKFSCPGAQIILAVNKYGSGGYLYYLNHPGSFGHRLGPLCAEAVCHGEDLFYIFDTLEFATKGNRYLTPGEQTLAQQMQKYWGAFSATGNPSGSGLLDWPLYESSSNTSMNFDVPTISTVSGNLQTYCNFWDSLSNETGSTL